MDQVVGGVCNCSNHVETGAPIPVELVSAIPFVFDIGLQDDKPVFTFDRPEVFTERCGSRGVHRVEMWLKGRGVPRRAESRGR